MNVPAAVRPASHRWIAGAALVWNLIGLLMFVLHVSMSPTRVAALSAPERAVYEASPAWLDVAFGVAVVSGVLGSVGLLRGRRWAVACFQASLAAMLVQFGGLYLVTPAWHATGAAGLLLPVLLVVIGVLLLRHAQRATRLNVVVSAP